MSLQRFSRTLFFVALCSISLLALYPSDHIVSTGWDKGAHLLAFFVLLWLMDFAYPSAKFWRTKVLWLTVYGVLIEFIQGVMPFRELSGLDIVADVAGLACYILLRAPMQRFMMLVDNVLR